MPADFEISPLIPQPVTPEPLPPVIPSPTPVGPVPPSVPPPMTPKKRNSLAALKWLVLVAAGMFALSIAYLWWGGNSFSDKGVTVTIDGPDRVTSGDEATYTIKWRNDTRTALNQMSFRMFYPEGSIVLVDGKTTKPESEGFVIESLAPGQSGERQFKAYIVGDKGAIKTARVHLIFNAGTLRSAFEKDATVTTAITNLPVTLNLVAPPTAVSGQVIQYILDVRNDSEEDLSDLNVVFTYPDGFVVQKMNPTPTQGNTTWHIDTLAKAQGKRYTITGALTGQERDTKNVGVVLQHPINGQYVDYVSTDSFTLISSPLLSVTVTPNGSRDYTSFAGDTLRYSVNYTNNSAYTLIGLLLGVKLEGDMYDFSRLQVDAGFFDGTSQTVAYDSSGVPELASLRPGQSGRVTFSVPLKAGFSGSVSGGSSFFVKATAKLSTSNVPSGVDGSEVAALDSVITKISSQPTLSQAILYDNGAGSGPLPPQVGQDTSFTVRWQLTNPGNDVRTTTVTATLPPGVTFVGGSTATNGTAPTYDKNSSKVTWTVGTLPFGTGNGIPKYEATFKVSIKPASNQQGQSVPLVAGATLAGTDSFTSQVISSKLKDFSTDSVENHSKDGRVQ